MTQEISSNSILSLFETNKEQRQSFVMQVVDSLDSVDPLKIHFQIKCMEDVIKLLSTNSIYKSRVLEASEKYGQKSFEYQTSKVEIKETGVKYDYSKCGDVVLERLLAKYAEIGEVIKARETVLKATNPKGMTLIDEETGETFTVYPPAKSSTTSVAVTLK